MTNSIYKTQEAAAAKHVASQLTEYFVSKYPQIFSAEQNYSAEELSEIVAASFGSIDFEGIWAEPSIDEMGTLEVEFENEFHAITIPAGYLAEIRFGGLYLEWNPAKYFESCFRGGSGFRSRTAIGISARAHGLKLTKPDFLSHSEGSPVENELGEHVGSAHYLEHEPDCSGFAGLIRHRN